MNRTATRVRQIAGVALTGVTLLLTLPASAQQPAAPRVTVSPDGASVMVTATTSAPAAFASDRVIVKFRNGQSPLPNSPRSAALHGPANIHLVHNPAGMSVKEALDLYRANPNVVYAEPDYTVTAIVTPGDPAFALKQWDMTKIAAPAAWDLHTDSSNVVVAVIDTGVDYSHPDLQTNLYADATTPSIHGYTCIGGACVAGGADDHGHGTHVAGTIGAAANNGVGMAGLNWNTRILSMKFLNAGGSGSISDAVLAFHLLRTLKQGGVNIRVTNNSWGGGGYSQALKDAMAALEVTPGYPGTLNVCAAGNSGANADYAPMYPAGYDNRGILSVLASDSNDVGASFTNFGLASVDIAAPGVSTYSTSPTGTCSLCDPSGYRYLSGTSMASPHVAGVATALLSRNPNLSAAQARDALLDPGSYDTVTDAKAKSTSSGGRLNFAKALNNTAFLAYPVLNQFPVLTVGPNVFATAGTSVNFSATASDPDGDALRVSTGRGNGSAGTTWLLGWQLNALFPTSLPFTAPAVARAVEMSYETAVADNRGGGAAGRNWAVVSPVASPGAAPTVALTVPATGTVGVPVSIGIKATDPENTLTAWDLFTATTNGASGICCYTGTAASITFNSAGVYRVSAQAMDRELHASAFQSAVISIGGASGLPPIADALLDKVTGPAPLTVNIDMSPSSDPDGVIASYFPSCGPGETLSGSGPKRSCRFSEPGVYWLQMPVLDNQSLMGIVSKYVVVTPPVPVTPPPPDTTAPTVGLISPASGASVTGSISLQATATDNSGGSGVKEVEYFLDAANGPSLGKSSVAPFTVAWNTAAVSAGPHTIYAIARDNAGNPSAPASVAVTVTVILPAVSLTPAGPLTVNRKNNVPLAAAITNAPTFPVSRVDFVVDGVVACSDATAAYACTWKAPNAARTVQVKALAYDNKGNVGTSNILTITVR